MQRDIMQKLIQWAGEKPQLPLVLHGARQVGKTWLLRELGRTSYENTVYINLDNNRFMWDQFELGYDLQRLLAAMELQSRQPIVPGKTLLILDEIQECPKALTSLKYFAEERPDLSIGAAGSLPGLAIHQGTGYPVGKVTSIDVYPLSFREYLDAAGLTSLRDITDAGDKTLLSAFSSAFTEQLRSYMYVGGMPSVVSGFLTTNDYVRVRELQRDILEGYRQDISKHVPLRDVEAVLAAWESIPSHLSHENKRFVFGHVREGARAKAFQGAITWLTQAGLAVRVPRVSKPAVPPAAYSDLTTFKLFLNDIGLLAAMANLDALSVLSGSSIFTEFKGALTEQYVCQQLLSECHTRPYYWKANNARAEVDSVVQSSNRVFGIEVKAIENLRSQRLRAFHEKFPETEAVRLSLSDLREQDWMRNVPLYAMSNQKLWLSQNQNTAESLTDVPQG